MTQSNSAPDPLHSSTPSRLAVIARQLSRGTVLDALASASPVIRRVATEWLTRLSPDESTGILKRGIEGPAARSLGVLRALKHPDLELSESLFQRVLSLLELSDEVTRRAIAEVVVQRRPEESARLLDDADCRQDVAILRTLCRADDPARIVPLMTAFGFPERRPPPTIGFLVTPTWLGEHHALHPEQVEWLIRECGYCDDPVTPEVLDLLALGLSCVVPEMSATGPADKWLERLRTLTWRLLPESDDTTRRDVQPVNLQDPIDTALFLSAVRETDRRMFTEHQAMPPQGRFTQSEPAPVCFHAPARHARRLFLTEAFGLAHELGLADADLPSFIVDHARVALETVPETRIAADRNLRTKWLLHRAWPTPSAPVPATHGTRRPSRFAPVIKPVPPHRLVIGEFVPAPPDPKLSPGAQSICHLAAIAGLDSEGLADWLEACERRWSRHVTPIGIELQIPKVDPNIFGGWKDALPFVGIPSPDRPEFGGMVEAAFRPAKSFHAMLLAPVLLHRLGLISPSEPQDIALHISLQGDLGDQSRYLAFPQLFIHPSQRLKNRPDAAMTRVMSKGLIHCNRDIECLDPDAGFVESSANVRTEFRMFRVFSDEHDARTAISSSYVEDLVATQLIGSAMVSTCQSCRSLVADYGRQIEDQVTQLPDVFALLLHGNFHESTGDPHDELLMQQLPIIRAWSDVRHHVREHNQQTELDQTFRDLRSRHMETLSNHFRRDHGLDLFEDLRRTTDWVSNVGGWRLPTTRQ